ncbi:hypothetical protein SLEP1_g9751 [Rubroshorea leprosula]|uniref:ELMO domain-containing protein n=1 Tax=Rubroshorea leprosula TaxID=152421 RepID=A0AAV5IBV0_9ROSI|nr:hypothetical protein SLEP1_g9751 [Rubroshorea leprosula]
MVGSRSWIGGLLNRVSNRRNERFLDYPLTPIQEERLQRLQERLQVPFDGTRPNHQEALKALWDAAFPNISLKGLISKQWKSMGWQGPNPSTDFRLLFKQDGERAVWEYSFAVAGINISFMLIQMLDLYAVKPRCLPGVNFLKLLEEDEQAFDVLYCIAFEMMDAQWLAMHASYMDFNVFAPLALTLNPLLTPSHIRFMTNFLILLKVISMPFSKEKNKPKVSSVQLFFAIPLMG